MADYQKIGQINNLSIPAGQSVQVNQNGSNAYFVVATGAVNLRARTHLSAQAYSLFYQGTGIRDTEFSSVEVQNPNAFSVVISLWVGHAAFDDKRLILNQTATPSVANPTYPDPGSAPSTNVDIADLSGGPFTDINGNLWLALYRVMILISNLDAGVVLLVQKSGGTGASPAILAVQPLTDRAIPVSGDYTINNGGANLNCIISELYASIPQT